MSMNNIDIEHLNAFQTGALVTWYDHNGKRPIPIPGVVVRYEPGSVVIKTYVQGKTQEIHVNPEELVSR